MKKFIYYKFKIVFVLLSCFYSVFSSATTQEAIKLNIEINLPDLAVTPYHRPYVAVWLETLQREHVTTISLWADDLEWHKDLRQWWRKAGDEKIDGVTGATRRPGKYQIKWMGFDEKQRVIEDGEYYLNIEVVREEGGRNYFRQKISLGQRQQYELKSKTELHTIKINSYVKNNKE